jgi:hypothetical protein
MQSHFMASHSGRRQRSHPGLNGRWIGHGCGERNNSRDANARNTQAHGEHGAIAGASRF